MFDNLIDNLNPDKWVEIDESAKNDDWKKYHVIIHHNFAPDNDATLVLKVATDEGEPKSVELKDCQSNKDPLKQVGLVELLLNSDENEVIGIDLNGDVVIRK